MDTKQLKKLKRSELLGMLLQRSKELEKVQAELEAERAAHKETRETLDSQRIAIEESGSIAEATVRISGIMEEAQAAADQYLQRVRAQAEEEISRLVKARQALKDRGEVLDSLQKKLDDEVEKLKHARKELAAEKKQLAEEREALIKERKALDEQAEETDALELALDEVAEALSEPGRK